MLTIKNGTWSPDKKGSELLTPQKKTGFWLNNSHHSHNLCFLILVLAFPSLPYAHIFFVAFLLLIIHETSESRAFTHFIPIRGDTPTASLPRLAALLITVFQ